MFPAHSSAAGMTPNQNTVTLQSKIVFMSIEHAANLEDYKLQILNPQMQQFSNKQFWAAFWESVDIILEQFKISFAD